MLKRFDVTAGPHRVRLRRAFYLFWSDELSIRDFQLDVPRNVQGRCHRPGQVPLNCVLRRACGLRSGVQRVVPERLPERLKGGPRLWEIAPHKGEAAEDRYVAGDDGAQRSEQNPCPRIDCEDRDEGAGHDGDGEHCGTEPPDGQSPVSAAAQCRLVIHTTHRTG